VARAAMVSQSDALIGSGFTGQPLHISREMLLPSFLRQLCAALSMASLVLSVPPALAQSGAGKSLAQPAKPGGEATRDAQKEAQKQRDEIAEAARVLTGPAGNPECLWLGRRVVGLLWRDDLDTAFRHLDLYDRFGCPSAHIQAAFRCLIRQGPLDAKAQETLNGRVFACWLNPAMPPAQADTAAPADGKAPNK